MLVDPLAVYIPRATRDKPPAAARILSQSLSRALAPVPNTEPAVLQNTILDLSN